MAEFSKDEIKGVIISMAPDKAPCPDGYTIEFFQKGWELVQKDIFSFGRSS